MSRPRLKKVLGWSGAMLGGLVLLIVALTSWLLFTTSGARWVAQAVTQRFAPQVSYESVDGTIAGELSVSGLRFEAGPDTAKIRIAHMTVDPTLRMLLSRTLRIDRATVTGLMFTLPEQPKADEPDEPLWIEPPIEAVVSEFALLDGRVFDGGKELMSVKQLDIAARWTREALVIDKLSLLPGDIEGRFFVTGRITPEARVVRAVLEARWDDVVIPAKLAGRELHTAGALDIDGTPDRYAARGEMRFGPPGELARMVLALNGTPQSATLDRFDIIQAAGKLALRGTLGFEAPLSWDLTARADDFNPGAFLAQWPGRFDLDVATRGELADAGPRGNLHLRTLEGELRGRPIAGGGQFEFAAPARLAGDLRMSSGRSRVAVTGRSRDRQDIDATVDLDIASLNDWLPGSKGSLSGRFRASGAWPELKLAGAADGRGLGVGRAEDGSYAVALKRLRIQADVDSPLDPRGDLDITANTVELAGQHFTRVHVAAAGDAAKHRVTLEARGEKLDARLDLAGGLTKTGWSGELSALQLGLPDIADLALRNPARVVYDAGAFSVSRACLADGDSSLCVAAITQANGELDASYSFDKVPLALANAIVPDTMPGQLRGEVQGQGKVRRAAGGQWFGAAEVSSDGARLVMVDEEPGETALGQQTFTLYENLKLQARLEGNRAEVRLNAALDQGGRLDGTLGLSHLTSAAPTLDGNLAASMPSLAPFAALVPTVANLGGSVDAKLRIGGTTAAPEFTGNLDARRLQADLGELGIELREGEVRGEAARGGGFRLAGRVHSGKGHVSFDGGMSARGEVNLRIDGENFQAAEIPAANVVITPDLVLTGDRKAYLLKGTVTIPSADINLQKLPQDESPGVSPDVVVVRDGQVVQSAAKQGDVPLTAQVLVKMGERIAVTGYGLDARVLGELTVREAPGESTTGSGQLTVTGTYKAYGQDLTIEEGRLLFAGTPLDNPRLSILAMREIDDDLSTGLRIAGSAKRPVITVVSDPNVGEADALSYLVTGRSLSDVGSASGSSQDALASATRSLEGAAGGLVAKRIGQRLGLDEAGVEENEMIGGSALTIGEYLSPRLYLSYGVGLFEPGEVIALRYKLSEDIGVRVQRGSEETRAGVEYRIER